MSKKRLAQQSGSTDLEQILSDLESPDEAARAKAARWLCPCRTGWHIYEQCMDLVYALQKDPSPLVRAEALHVEEHAYEREAIQTRRAEVAERAQEGMEQANKRRLKIRRQ